jgi:hypothetical protein
MGYWITLVEPERGLTALQTIEWQNAQFDPGAMNANAFPLQTRWTREQRDCWERICDGVVTLVGDTDREEFPSYLGIASRDPRIRLDYSGDQATITVPYWYQGDHAAKAIALAYAIGRIVEKETTLVGVDSQTAAGLDENCIDDAVALYTGTRASAVRAVYEEEV